MLEKVGCGRDSEQSSGAGEFAVLLWCVWWMWGCGALCVVEWRSGSVGTGYEVGGWCERHGALCVNGFVWWVVF